MYLVSKCRLDASVFHDQQHDNNDKCRCEFKELINEGRCNAGFIWNPSICECECDKSSDIKKYLDYVDCMCRKRLIDKLVDEFIKDINGNEMIHKETLDDQEKVCNPCIIYTILLVIIFITLMNFGSLYIYFYWHTMKKCFNKLSCKVY